MKHSKIKALSLMGGVPRKLVTLSLTLIMVLAMSITSFADVEITKDWNDDLSGGAAKGRSVPSVTITGEASYEKLLNMFYPVGSYYESSDPNFDPNTAWGGTWESENRIDTSYNIVNGEVPIGTWTNGKTIYRKVLSGTSSAGTTSISISNLGIETFIRGDLIMHNTNGNRVYGSYVQNLSTDSLNWYIAQNFSTIYLRSGSSYAFGQYYMIIEYTKTSSASSGKEMTRWHRVS